jgi:hypothetical protein
MAHAPVAFGLDSFLRWPSSYAPHVPRKGHVARGWAHHFDELLWTWSLSFRTPSGEGEVLGHVWGRNGPNFFLLHREQFAGAFATCVARVVSASAEHAAIYTKLLPVPGTSPLVLSALLGSLLGVEVVRHTGREVDRLRVAARLAEAGRVYVPANLSAWEESDSTVAALALWWLDTTGQRASS